MGAWEHDAYIAAADTVRYNAAHAANLAADDIDVFADAELACSDDDGDYVSVRVQVVGDAPEDDADLRDWLHDAVNRDGILEIDPDADIDVDEVIWVDAWMWVADHAVAEALDRTDWTLCTDCRFYRPPTGTCPTCVDISEINVPR